MKFIKKALCSNIFLIILSMMMSIMPSHAEIGRKTPSLDGSVSAGPYYNPASKSYFELFKLKPGQKASRWGQANELAQKHLFRTTQGRLAVIKDLATHQFILRNFKALNFWIGLQYFCGTQTLKWVDEDTISETDFTAWAYQWARTDVRCGGHGYMPVSYTRNIKTNASSSATRWQATGSNKGFVYYLVEYTTGKE